MPICNVCLNSDILCARCTSLLESGEISETEIKVARAVHELGKETGMKMEFLRTLHAGRSIAIVAEPEHAGKLIGLGGRNARRLADLLGGDVRIIENGPERRMIENVLRVQVSGVNKIYGGSEAYRVRVKRKDMDHAQRSLKVLERVLGKRVFLSAE